MSYLFTSFQYTFICKFLVILSLTISKLNKPNLFSKTRLINLFKLTLKPLSSRTSHFSLQMRTVLKRTFASYQKTLQQSLDPNLEFWRQSATQVKWAKPPSTILKTENSHFFKWYPDGKMNITQNCLDRHLADRPNQIAYYYESPLTNTRSTITYAELHKKVSEFAGSLQSNFGIKKGDAVVIYMPMVLESLVAILACARIGAPHVVVFGGFSAHELGNRIIDCNPKLLICANAGKQPNKTIDYLKIVNQALKYSKRQDLRKIILQRDLLPKHTFTSNQFDFNKVLNSGKYVSPTIMDSTDHLYYLYTSGTTGKPKGIMRDHGGTAVILQNAMKYVYDTKPNDGMFCTSDIGWVLGHSFIIYGPLLVGLRSVLFEGKPVGTPDAGVYWEILQRNNIQHLYTSPTAIRSIRKQDPHGKFIKQRNLSSLKTVTCVGERCDIPTFQWLLEEFPNQFVNDTYWQTESGSPILSNFCGFEQKFKPKAGSATKALPGYDVRVLDQKTGKQCAPNEPGIICIKQPLPPSFMLSILNNDQLYVDKYFKTFEGYYNTGDSGMVDQDGYFSIMSRVDDVINTAGHRLSTGQMEQAIMLHPKIAEAIVIGANDQIKGEVPVGFVTIKAGYECDPATIEKEVVKLIREEIGPVASFKTCHVVPRLPKTRSGKYLRHIMRKMYNKQKYEVPSTVQDIEVVHELERDMPRMLSNHK